MSLSSHIYQKRRVIASLPLLENYFVALCSTMRLFGLGRVGWDSYSGSRVGLIKDSPRCNDVLVVKADAWDCVSLTVWD
jgi:hypothetical protein